MQQILDGLGGQVKKILKHLGQWDVKRKPLPIANAPPIDVFPTYDEQPGPSTDDYTCPPWRITDPDLCASGALPCRGLFLKPYSGSQASYAQNPEFLANLQQNAFLTVRLISDT